MFVIKKVFYCSSDNVAFFPTREEALKFWYDHYSPGWPYEKYEQSYKENGIASEYDKYYLIFEMPMKAIAINEENHGLVGIAKDFPSAIDFLVVEGWIDEEFRIYPLEDDSTYERVVDTYGENWVEALKSLSEEDLCTLFDGNFYFKKFEVFGA